MRRGVTRPRSVARGLAAALSVACGLALLAHPAQARTGGCAQAVIDDWAKGGLDHPHAARCYRAALAALPEDARIYSSAPDDIRRAYVARSTRAARVRKVAAVASTRSAASARSAEGSGGGLPAPALLAASLALVLVILSSAGALLYRRLAR